MQFLYLLVSRRRLFRLKFGISRTLFKRWGQISKSEPFVPIIAIPLIFAVNYELFLKRRYKRYRALDMRGSGRTEWFIFWLPFRPLLWVLFFAACEWGALIFLILIL